jgi:hypothetical protein
VKPQDGIQYRYSDLMCRFEDTLLARARAAKLDGSFPATVGINGFRGFLDEFVRKLENKELPEVKEKKTTAKPKKKKEPKEAFIVSSIPDFLSYPLPVIWSSNFSFDVVVSDACHLWHAIPLKLPSQ